MTREQHSQMLRSRPVAASQTPASQTTEQTVQYNPGQGRPIIEVRLRLTTAVAGQRTQDGLVEAAYLLRLEVLEASHDACVEGFSLGPWKAGAQTWEPGAIYVSPPVWAGFGPQVGPIQGRIFIHDRVRHRLLDLPWRAEGVTPGIQPLA